ncbi:MAG: hypothetical protein RQ729_06235 [Wenzhouxiangellaceae bacterium]|nr:hypothetical protein [Wenzhouxiangellaceae bacterium]
MNSFPVKSMLVAGGMLVVLASAAAASEAPPEAARCIGCHTERGITDRDHIPTIAGMGAFYLENQMMDSQSGNGRV